MIWKILEIEKTKDEGVITAAYRRKLHQVNPEDDQEGFMELRKAYEEAMQYASTEENESFHNVDVESHFKGKKNEVDLWIEKVDCIYRDVKTRIDELRWKDLLKDSVCENLDTELEAGEKLLVYFMTHSYMPQNIWQLTDKKFGYLENFNSLKEKFPENYLEYVKWQISKPSFIDYRLFDGETDKDVDIYINKLYEAKAVSEERDLSRLKQLIKELKRFDVRHPFADTEEARCLLLEAELLGEELGDEGQNDTKENSKTSISEMKAEKKQRLLEHALSIMEDLEFEYSDNPYIERIYAETLMENGKLERAKTIYEALLEKDETNYIAVLGRAKCIFLEGDAEKAKEQIEDVLEERVQDADSLELLEAVNKVLVEQYERKLQEEKTPELCYKLGWCYYQQKRFNEGIHLLDELDTTEEYDYVNLRCRLYLASDRYREAFPLAEKWLALIEASEDDGTKEMKKRKNRLSLAHFSLGICLWELVLKKGEQQEREKTVSEVVSYIKKAMEEESNILVRFSYMEQLARFYLDAKDYNACIGLCDEMLERDRGFFPAYVHRQKAHYELKHAKEVIDDYFACVEIYPAYAPPYVLAAEVFYAFEQYDDVEQVIEAAKEAGIESDSLKLYKIRCLHYKEFSRENTELAMEQMEKLRSKVLYCEQEETDIEEIAEVEKEYAILYWDLDETDKALEIIESFLKKHGDDVTMLHLQADVLTREKRLQEALEVCERLVQLEPKNLHTRTKLGNCYERLDDIKQAVTCYQEILKINPEFVPAIRRMMYIYSYLSNHTHNLEQCKKAVKYATRFIELTESSEGYIERGNLYIDLYDLDNAVADCKKAIELDPEAYYAYNNLGCALLKLRRVEEAIVPLKQVVAMDPDRDHLPYLNLAESYVLLGEYDKAVQMYHEVMRIHPDATHIWKEIAIVYTKAKQYDKAIEIYSMMLEDAKESVGNRKIMDKVKGVFEGTLTQEDRKIQLLCCDIADVYRQSGNIHKAEEYYNMILLKRSYQKISADAAGKLAEYYRDQGELKKAYELLRYMKKHVAKEDIGTEDYEHLNFISATVYFEMGNEEQASVFADDFLEAFRKRRQGEEELLKDEKYCRMHQYVFVVMYACTGRMELAKKYLQKMQPCKLCVTCETSDCFEYFFASGLIAELEKHRDEAIRCYEKAIHIKGDYPCAKRHLEKLLDGNG